jgi:hypothetical protein
MHNIKKNYDHHITNYIFVIVHSFMNVPERVVTLLARNEEISG